ncbi:protein serine/threonine kinase [Gracilaria domingensis]|nr:protein serine/threonine kinase [Gracilaria domingensis]
MFHNRCDCVPGFIRSQELNECVPCPPGTYQYAYGFDRASEGCASCGANEFQPKFGQTECLPCPEGMRPDTDGDRCVPCDKFTCGNCPEFHTLPRDRLCVRTAFPTPRSRPDGALEQVLCPGGLGSQVDISTCRFVSCPDGTGVMSDGSCSTCSPGTFYNRTTYECQPCGLHQFMDVENVIDGCFECAEDSFSLPGASECIQCPINQGLMADGRCATCEAGTFYNETELRCELCPPNTFSRGDVTGSLVTSSNLYNDCRPCPQNTFSFAGSSTCREDLCARDNAPMIETGECGTCPPGKEYIRALATCQRCTARASFEPLVKGNFGLFGCRPCFRGSVDADLTMCNVSPRS